MRYPFVFSDTFNDQYRLTFNESSSLLFTGGREIYLFAGVPAPTLFTIVHASALMLLATVSVTINYL